MKPSTRSRPLLLAAPLSIALGAFGLGTAQAPDAHTGGIQSAAAPAVQAPYDILHAKVTTKGNVAVFHMNTSGPAGSVKPAAIGKLAGSMVHSYVWPTSIDPSAF